MTELKKKDLCEQAGISSATFTKLVRNESVTTESFLKICAALDWNKSNIMEIVRIENVAGKE